VPIVTFASAAVKKKGRSTLGLMPIHLMNDPNLRRNRQVLRLRVEVIPTWLRWGQQL
jgi:hypothetical protein